MIFWTAYRPRVKCNAEKMFQQPSYFFMVYHGIHRNATNNSERYRLTWSHFIFAIESILIDRGDTSTSS